MNPSRWSRWTTITAVLMLAVIAAVVSYSHMYELALRHGEPEWRATLFPLSVDGMIVAASMTLLSDARNGRKGGLLPWTLLIIGSAASLAANVAVADPTAWSRIIHAWPSVALIGAYELLMREFRTAARSVRTASAANEQTESSMKNDHCLQSQVHDGSDEDDQPHLRVVSERGAASETEVAESVGSLMGLPQVQRDAWLWAVANRRPDGSLPSGQDLGERFGRKARWGRLVKQRGQQGLFEMAI